MSKWNLFEIFSHLDMTHEDLPEIRKTARFSHRAVRSRVMDALDAETEGAPARRHWKLRIPAAITAAAVLVSGSAITAAAAANGGFAQLMQLVFGKDVSYPSALEELYTVPEVEMTNTCDGIDCQVLGVFGDEHNVNVVLEFSGVNGFTLPNYTRFLGSGAATLGYNGGESMEETATYDASDGGHLYVRQHFSGMGSYLSGDEITYELSIDKFLVPREDSGEENFYYYLWSYNDTYDMRRIRNWLGYSVADINTRKALSAQEEQLVWENFVPLDETYSTGDSADENAASHSDEDTVYVSRKDVLTEGSLHLRFRLDYPVVESVKEDFVYTDAKNGEETPMTMELTPWGASFTWSDEDPTPAMFGYAGTSVPGFTRSADCLGYAKTGDQSHHTKIPVEDNNLFYSAMNIFQVSCAAGSPNDGHTTLNISFLEPVDPQQVQAVYAGADILMWEK